MGPRQVYARVNRSDCYVHRCSTDCGWPQAPTTTIARPGPDGDRLLGNRDLEGLLRFWADNQGRRRRTDRLQLAGALMRASGEDCLVPQCDSVVEGVSSWATPSQRLWRPGLPR